MAILRRALIAPILFRSDRVSTKHKSHIAVMFGLLFLMVLVAGCDRSDQLLERQRSDHQPGSRLVGAKSTPREILNDCISRYQQLRSYQDHALVRLAYNDNGQPTEDHAPLSVAWDSHGEIGLQVYSVAAGPTTSGRWHLSLGKTYAGLADQILSRQLPKQISLSWLLSEPLVSESLSAGLGGFPPQLDLLLNPQPLSRLVDETAAVSLLEPQSIEDKLCSLVSVNRSGLVYVFWIERQTNLLRRLELPTQLLPQEILADSSISNIRLTIEFRGATVDQSIDWSEYRPVEDSKMKYVQRFVPPPPKVETALLGKQIPAFRLSSPSGSTTYDSTVRSGRKASVLMWLADHPACLAAAEQLLTLEQQLSRAGITGEVVELVPIWAESQPPEGMTFEQLQKHWKLPGRLALDRNAAGRDLFQVQEAPTVVILDGQGKLQFHDVRLNPLLDRALAPIVSRLVEGVDVAGELVQSQNSAELRFRAQLAQAAAADAPESQCNVQDAYPPEFLQLVPKETKEFPTRIIALVQDSRSTAWALQSDGLLQQLDATLKPLQSYQTQWPDLDRGIAQLLPSADGGFFALSLPGAIEVFDIKSRQSIRYKIPNQELVRDMQWLTLATDKSQRLAVITSGKQILLLDPENRQQLSGISPIAPLAITSLKGSSDLNGLVVLENGALESVILTSAKRTQAVTSRQNPIPEPGRKLPFRPGHGPWQTFRTPSVEQTLATGWLADEELALVFLDDKMQPFWHYRLPLTKPTEDRHAIASALSPGNGSTVWAVLDATNTIHLLRGDVMWSDHFRQTARVTGIALVPAGDRLALLVAANTTVTAYELH